MNKMKFVTMLLLLLLVACGTGNEQTADSKEVQTKSTESQNGVETGEYRQFNDEVGETSYPKVEMVTSKGTITIELYPDIAPKAVENFLTHSKNGYYNGLSFHRVMNEFMIQGGDPLGNGTGGESIFGKGFEDEFSPEVYNLRGALSMANSGPNTNGSQFFIVQKKQMEPELIKQMQEKGFEGGVTDFPEEIIQAYSEMGGTPWLDYRHTVFGHVLDGLEIVDAIAAVEVNGQAMPLEPVTIETINIIE